MPLYTIDKEGKLHVITDSFDGTVPRDRKLIALVVDDEVQPKAVDVTPKQEQARMAADASFESSSKVPEKRKEKELNNVDTAAPEPVANTSKKTEPPTDAPLPANGKAAEAKVDATNTVYKDTNAAAPTKAKATTPNHTNGSVPKNKKGALDPHRLPDSGQSSNSVDSDKTNAKDEDK